jgi:quinoprotein glucose dehydrogenase
MARLSLQKSDAAMWAVSLLAVLALVDSIFNYVWTGNGIHGSEGALVVVVSTLLLAVAAAIVAAGRTPGWVRIVLEILIVLDFIGTAAAAYLLEAWILLGLIVLAAIGWIVHLTRRAPTPVPNLG